MRGYAAAMPRWTATDIPDQTGCTVVITGANTGLGLSSARALAAKGARVVLACRDEVKAADALEAVKQEAVGAAPELIVVDLANLDSVRSVAATANADFDCVDVLMNNAGVMATPLRRTAEGFEMQIGTNHLGHFALTGLLLPALLASARATGRHRVLVRASDGSHPPGRPELGERPLLPVARLRAVEAGQLAVHRRVAAPSSRHARRADRRRRPSRHILDRARPASPDRPPHRRDAGPRVG